MWRFFFLIFKISNGSKIPRIAPISTIFGRNRSRRPKFFCKKFRASKSKRDKNKWPQLKFENRNSKLKKNASSQKSKIEDSKVLKIKESTSTHVDVRGRTLAALNSLFKSRFFWRSLPKRGTQTFYFYFYLNFHQRRRPTEVHKYSYFYSDFHRRRRPTEVLK